MANEPKVGQKAPDFTLMDDAGNKVKLGDLKGKKVVLPLPQDDTPGCTKEACALRRHFPDQEKGAIVVGVSADSVESHRSSKTNSI
jgi:peroxiredoxin Q/BCP